jgi:pyrroloquinoline-quinone synthase
MDTRTFWCEFNARIEKYDLLVHSFYQAWTDGLLSKDDLRMYSSQYYKHIEAFPGYLEMLENRLADGGLKQAIKENRLDELGALSSDKRSHSDIWLDFAAGMGADRSEVDSTENLPQINQLVDFFGKTASKGNAIEALAAFCAYESQVPRIAKEKAVGLKQHYGADAKSYKYFSIHATADIEHTKVWRELIEQELENGENDRDNTIQLALDAAEKAAQHLWQALDGIEMKRTGMSQDQLAQSALAMAC